jgi:hypothetical protein
VDASEVEESEEEEDDEEAKETYRPPNFSDEDDRVFPTPTELLALLRSGDADEDDRCVGRTGVPMLA